MHLKKTVWQILEKSRTAFMKVIKMKIDSQYENRQARKVKRREDEWREIDAYRMTIIDEPGAVKRTAEKFGCSMTKVITAQSFMLKFGKYGSKNK